YDFYFILFSFEINHFAYSKYRLFVNLEKWTFGNFMSPLFIFTLNSILYTFENFDFHREKFLKLFPYCLYHLTLFILEIPHLHLHLTKLIYRFSRNLGNGFENDRYIY